MAYGKIKVELKYWSGDDLAVISAAKESFNRKAEWGCAEAKTLKPNDQKLMTMLARGMGDNEYQELHQEMIIAGLEQDGLKMERLMWKFRHTTPHLAPFGHCYATFRFQAPVFVMRHIVKHEYIRLSELSMRYVRGMPEYYKPESWRAMAENVKHGSGGDHGDQLTWGCVLDDAYEEDKFEYEHALSAGLCPEQARTFLRLCHMTEGTFSGSMDAIAGIVTKRLDPHAQEETREFARQIDKQMHKPYPVAWAALTEGLQR